MQRILFWIALAATCSAGLAAQPLGRGRTQIKVFGGTNAIPAQSGFLGPSEQGRAYSVGLQAAWGLTESLAVTGEYGFNQLRRLGQSCSFGCFASSVDRRVDNFTAGLRYAWTRDRLTPFVEAGLAAARSSMTQEIGTTFERIGTSVAVQTGVGFDVAIRPQWGISLAVHAIYPIRTTFSANLALSSEPLLRVAPGFYYRF